MKARLALAAGAALALCSCDHKELCFNHNEHALKYQLEARTDYELEWERPWTESTRWELTWDEGRFGLSYDSMRPTEPDGLRVVVYNSDRRPDIFNMPSGGGVFYMSEGEHSLLFFNNDTEYILFSDLETSPTAASTPRTRSTYFGNPALASSAVEPTVNAPDMLYAHYIPAYTPDKTLEAPVRSVAMKPLVCRYLIRYEFDYGLNYVALARGALSGMASSVSLADGRNSSEPATILYDAVPKEDRVEAVVNSFGVPGYPAAIDPAAKYGLNLEVRMKNGKMLNFFFDITGQVQAQPRGGVIVVSGLRITDDQGKEDSGSFDVTIDGWGDYIDIPLEM